MSLLSINNLSIRFHTDEGRVHAVKDVNLKIQSGEAIAVVGESGAGKSQVFQAVMGLLSGNAEAAGEILFDDQSLLNQSDRVLNQYRGQRISIVFQDPMTSLNPYLTIGKQLIEVLQIHQGKSYQQAKSEALAMLEAMQLRQVERCFQQYPHELSGGMRQRVAIAMALLCEPDLLILDEPTTALDVTVQAEIMQLLKAWHAEKQMAIVLITHDLPLALNFCERVLVMYAGRVVESGQTNTMLYQPKHPYTQALLAASPQNPLDISGRLPTIEGVPPDPLQPISGCAFAPRCQFSDQECDVIPVLESMGQHQLACVHPVGSTT